MKSVWMGICPSRTATRVVAMTGPSETILKARLAMEPNHPRALGTLLEAVALWQGYPVRAALCVGDRVSSCGSNLYREAFSDEGGALYSVVWVRPSAHRPRRTRLEGLGKFRDLERIVVEQVAE